MLSFKKLEKLISQHGYIIREIFSIGGQCVYISVVSIKTSEFFLVYIPSKYNIPIDTKYKSYKLKEINVSSLSVKSEVDCAGDHDELSVQLKYMELEDTNRKGKLSDHLDKKYDFPLEIKKSHTSDNAQVKDLFRQISRLKYCVSGIKIKIAISYRDYITVVKRDNSLVCYGIKDYDVLDNMRRLLAVVDLENFCSRTIQTDIVFVREGIHRILNKNQLENIVLISSLLSGKNDFEKFLVTVQTKISDFKSYLKKFNNVLVSINEKEKDIIKKLDDFKVKRQTTGLQGVHLDMQTLNQISLLESELKGILDAKQETMRHIEDINTQNNDFLLFIDKILYDNVIMTDAIMNNFKLVMNYIK